MLSSHQLTLKKKKKKTDTWHFEKISAFATSCKSSDKSRGQGGGNPCPGEGRKGSGVAGIVGDALLGACSSAVSLEGNLEIISVGMIW